MSQVEAVMSDVRRRAAELVACDPESCGTHVHISQTSVRDPEVSADDLMHAWIDGEQDKVFKEFYHIARPRAPKNAVGDTARTAFSRGYEPMLHMRAKPYDGYPHHFEFRGYPCIVAQPLDRFIDYMRTIEALWGRWVGGAQGNATYV